MYLYNDLIIVTTKLIGQPNQLYFIPRPSTRVDHRVYSWINRDTFSFGTRWRGLDTLRVPVWKVDGLRRRRRVRVTPFLHEKERTILFLLGRLPVHPSVSRVDGKENRTHCHTYWCLEGRKEKRKYLVRYLPLLLFL